MYSVLPALQTDIFLLSLGLGFILGVLYDFFRLLRLTLSKSKILTIVFDILYFALLGLSTFLFILALNKGEIRSYIIIGEILGFLFYYFSLGILAVKVTDILTAFFKKLFSLIFRILSAPFRLIFRAFYRFSAFLRDFFKKQEKKSLKIQKKVLPKLRLYVYNLFGILGVGKASSKKGGFGFGKNKKEKTE